MRKIFFAACAVVFLSSSVAQADLVLNIEGVAGSGVTTWSFVTVNAATTSNADSIRDTTAVGWSTGDSMQFGSGDGIFDVGIQNEVLAFAGAASITIGATTESIGAVFLDDDGAGSGDDIGIRTVNELLYGAGETATWTGSGTVNVDINQLVIGSHTMNFGALWVVDQGNGIVNISAAAIPEPTSLVLLGIGVFGMIARFRRR